MENKRLYLLRLLVHKPNVLLLDEPTNELDTETLTILEDYIDDFGGSVITVSHDRYFLNKVAQEYWYIHDGYMEKSKVHLKIMRLIRKNKIGKHH